MYDRFQNQRWWVKVWRLRFYLFVPHNACMFHRVERLRWTDAWDLAKGQAQCRMHWYYDWDIDDFS